MKRNHQLVLLNKADVGIHVYLCIGAAAASKGVLCYGGLGIHLLCSAHPLLAFVNTQVKRVELFPKSFTSIFSVRLGLKVAVIDVESELKKRSSTKKISKNDELSAV